MATTTNYSWETPDDTDLVKDGAAAIRTLGSSIDTTTKALNPSTTLGDIEYRSSTANTNTRLAIGSTGNVLTVAGGVPTWAAPAGGGKVLQVVSATTTTSTLIQSTSFTDTGLSCSITPSAATSKILVLVTQNFVNYVGSGERAAGYQLLRGATAVNVIGSGGYEYTYDSSSTTVNGRNFRAVHTITYLDSPSTTSSTTYKTQAKLLSTANSSQITFQENSQTASIILLEIGA
jgi:hypothetical protein